LHDKVIGEGAYLSFKRKCEHDFLGARHIFYSCQAAAQQTSTWGKAGSGSVDPHNAMYQAIPNQLTHSAWIPKQLRSERTV
jgi:hypothetical protein